MKQQQTGKSANFRGISPLWTTKNLKPQPKAFIKIIYPSSIHTGDRDSTEITLFTKCEFLSIRLHLKTIEPAILVQQ